MDTEFCMEYTGRLNTARTALYKAFYVLDFRITVYPIGFYIKPY